MTARISSFNEFVGNQRIVDLLRKAGLPQSSLFAGPTGIGKKSLALLVARSVHCKHSQQPGGFLSDPCNSCRACLQAVSGNHPDILLFKTDKAYLGIDFMRRLNSEAHYRPFSGPLRFFIVDEAERLTEEAANSILKTLEEPPETSRIVLVSAFPNRLLPTIRSRCQTFAFQALSPLQIREYLARQDEVDHPELRAAFARGSLSEAITLNVETLIERRDLLLDLLTKWLRSGSFSAIFSITEARPFTGWLRKRDEVLTLIDILQMICFDLYFMLVRTPQRVANLDRRDELELLSRSFSLEELRNLLYHIQMARRDVERFVNPAMCFETLWLQSKR